MAFLAWKNIFKTIMYHYLKTYVNQRKYLKMVIRSGPDSVSLFFYQTNGLGLTTLHRAIQVNLNWSSTCLQCWMICLRYSDDLTTILTVLPLWGAQAQWLQPSELKHWQFLLTSREYTTLLSWLSSVQLPQTVQQLIQEPLAVSPSVERTPVQLPPCIAGQITSVIGSTQ